MLRDANWKKAPPKWCRGSVPSSNHIITYHSLWCQLIIPVVCQRQSKVDIYKRLDLLFIGWATTRGVPAMGNPVVSQKFHHLLQFKHVPHESHSFVHVESPVIITNSKSCSILSTVLRGWEVNASKIWGEAAYLRTFEEWTINRTNGQISRFSSSCW